MTINHPAIAVVIPSYNRADYLVETLHAIYAQTHTAKRVIVVDDGSTDHTLTAIEQFKALSPALEVIQQHNSGPAAARNKGIHAAHDCEWIAFCDSDDIWHPEKLAEQVRVLQNTCLDNVGCVYCINGQIDENGVRLPGQGHPGLYGNSINQIKIGIVPSGSMSSVMIRRDMLLQIDGFDENLQSDEDLELMIRLAPNCVFDFTTRKLTFIRIHSTKSSNDTHKLYKSKTYILNKHSSFFTTEGQFIKSLRYDILHAILVDKKWYAVSSGEKIGLLLEIMRSYVSTVWTHFNGHARASLLPLYPICFLLLSFGVMSYMIRKSSVLLSKVIGNGNN